MERENIQNLKNLRIQGCGLCSAFQLFRKHSDLSLKNNFKTCSAHHNLSINLVINLIFLSIYCINNITLRYRLISFNKLFYKSLLHWILSSLVCHLRRQLLCQILWNCILRYIYGLHIQFLPCKCSKEVGGNGIEHSKQWHLSQNIRGWGIRYTYITCVRGMECCNRVWNETESATMSNHICW